ncbi:m58 protein [Murid betaherpesvirus 1]|nr:m58 protein [Murid betaherpesvirus 1]
MTTGVALSQSDIAATMSASSRVFLRKNIQTAGATGARLERSSSAMATSPASKLYRSGGRSGRPRHQNLYIREAPGGFSSTKTSQSSRKRPRSLCHNVLDMVCAATCTNLNRPEGLRAPQSQRTAGSWRARGISRALGGPAVAPAAPSPGRQTALTKKRTVARDQTPKSPPCPTKHTRETRRGPRTGPHPRHTLRRRACGPKRGQRESLLRVPVFDTPLDGTDSNNPPRNRFVVS